MILEEASAGVRVREIRPDDGELGARGVIKRIDGYGAYVQWEDHPEVDPTCETWIPHISWLTEDA